MTFIISMRRHIYLLLAMLMMCSVSGRVSDNLREAAETEPTMDDNKNNVRRQETTVCGRRQILTSKRDDGKGGTNNDDHSDHLDKILGGSDVIYGQVPWQVNIYQRRNGNEHRICGGAIISEFWIVTSASCVYGVLPGWLRLVVGDHRLSHHDEGQRTYRAQRVVVHRLFPQESIDYDIALIKVKPTNSSDITNGSGIDFNDYVQPICLPAAGESPAANANLTVSGWGNDPTTLNSQSSDTLQTAVLPVFNHTRCSYELSSQVIAKRVLCVGSIIGGSTDVCELDYGGPATFQSGDTHILAGIIIDGTSCSPPVYRVFLTNVLFFRNWINVRINLDSTARQGLIPPRAD